VVTRCKTLDARSGLDDDARCFMTEDERHRLRQLTVDYVEIARAHAARGDLHEHLARFRRREFDFQDLDRFARAPENGCLHLHLGEPTQA
jgi:hypothetical protein